MMPFKWMLPFLFIEFFNFGGFSQKRIGADLNSHLINFNYSLHYQQVIKGPWIFSAGIFGGKYGVSENHNAAPLVFSGHELGIAYPQLNTTYTDTNGQYKLGSTATIGYGIGVHAGIGIFKEFQNFHGIRFNLNQRFGWMLSDVRSTYYHPDLTRVRYNYSKIWHPVTAISAEIYHTIRWDGRYTFYWGFKLPYYFTLDKERYNPKKDAELFHKFLFDLSMGITYAIGDCE